VDPKDASRLDCALLPGVGGALCLGHPKACDLLDEAAVGAGARYLRGVRHVQVTPGDPPKVSFEQDGQPREVTPRLVIGADGRFGSTRKQAGIEVHTDPLHHWFSGLLVEGAEGWPEDVGCFATEGDRLAFVFPQGQGRARLYLGLDPDDRGRLMGAEGMRNFLAAFDMRCMPEGAAIAAARPAGEIFGYPNADTWTDEPFAPGVVLIGDAAGVNDPIIGQGLSLTHRDVRLVSEILSAGDWSTGAFRPYTEERAERLRRLRIVGRFIAKRDAEFTPEARERRRISLEFLHAKPEAAGGLAAIFAGPEHFPAEAFSEPAIAAAWGPQTVQ
jgi:2-polyprenyl-6-methoxyphenol hydroxylase-like FAD-dependent oxidoreductase